MTFGRRAPASPPSASVWSLLVGIACLGVGRGLGGTLPEHLEARGVGEENDANDGDGEPGSSEQALVIACNGYADRISARVGVRPLPRHHHKAQQSPLRGGSPRHRAPRHHLRHRRSSEASDESMLLDVGPATSDADDAQQGDASSEKEKSPEDQRRAVAAAIFRDALWSRPLAYGECAEYHIDLKQRQLFFLTPGGGDVCKLSQLSLVKMTEPDFSSDEPSEIPPPEGGDPPKRLAVVLSQPQATSTRCALQTQALTHRLSRYGAAAAELAVIDAYSQSDGPEEIVIDGENATLPPLDTSAVVRLEDVVGPNIIAAENLASKTLGLGAEYAVEPKDLHVILEDLRGSEEFGHQDVSFRPDHTYVAIRLGRSGDAVFQTQLLFYEAKDGEK